MASFNQANKVKEQIAGKLLQQKDILGVGVGFYDPKNPKKGAGIIVYRQKAAASVSSLPVTLSASVKGKKISIPVRFVNNDEFLGNAAIKSSKRFRRRIRPVRAGYSIGTPKWSGTAGLIVTNRRRNQLYVASNNHVLNKNNSTSYTETIQPGGADGGRTRRDRIGRLYRFVKLRKTYNYLDAATSIPLRKRLLTPKYATVGVIRGHYANYRPGWRLMKVGRTSGRVRGIVQSINTDVKVNYGGYGRLGVILFKNQTIITSSRPISLPGDSGSVWLRNRYAVAVNYAGTADGKLSVAFPIHWLMQVFGTRVALPRTKGKILRLRKYNSAYTWPLNKKTLRSIKVLRARKR